MKSRIRVLFSGYAPVHFLCFRPLYRRLLEDGRFEVWFSGGLRDKTESGVSYAAPESLYAPFGVPSDRLLPTEKLADEQFDLFFGANTKGLRPGRAGTSVQIFHGISFRNVAIREAILEGWDYFFIAGPYMRRRLAETGILAADDPRGVPIGLMKTDALLARERSRESTLRGLGLRGDRPVVLFAPTGQRYNSLETMGTEVLQFLVASDRFDLVIKPHDHPKRKKDWRREFSEWLGPHCLVTSEPDVIPLLAAADVLLTDASSVSNEFTLLNRPMVFLDVPRLIEKARLKSPGFDLETWGRRAGDLVERPEDVVAALETALRDPQRHRSVREAMAADLFYHPGRATDAAMAWLLQKFFGEEPNRTG
jgi:hypothetical protein